MKMEKITTILAVKYHAVNVAVNHAVDQILAVVKSIKLVVEPQFSGFSLFLGFRWSLSLF